MPKARSHRRAVSINDAAGEPRKQSATLSEDAMPTRERLEHSTGAFEIGGRRGGKRVLRMLDTPLERIFLEHRLSPTQYDALRRLRVHWFLGITGRIQAANLDRTQADWSGLERNERELMHRQAFDAGWGGLDRPQAVVVNAVVLVEQGLVEAGAELGYRSPYRGRQAALELLQAGGEQLAQTWRQMVLC